MGARLMMVIVTDIELRGDSPREQQEGSVARRVTQYWSTDGELLAEVDPHPQKREGFDA